jgi:hypothetical protein
VIEIILACGIDGAHSANGLDGGDAMRRAQRHRLQSQARQVVAAADRKSRLLQALQGLRGHTEGDHLAAHHGLTVVVGLHEVAVLVQQLSRCQPPHIAERRARQVLRCAHRRS